LLLPRIVRYFNLPFSKFSWNILAIDAGSRLKTAFLFVSSVALRRFA